jgi:hypothetical protein
MVSRAANRIGMVNMSESTSDGRAADPLVTLAEAAAATGRPKEALRAMIRRGKLEAIRGNDGRFLVRLPSDISLQPRSQPHRGRAAERAADDHATAASRTAELEDTAEEWRAAAEEARLAAAVAAAERDAAKAAAAAEIGALRETVADLRGRLDRAEARLAAPWWRRLLGT